MDSKIWGPKAWFFLHAITLNYPINPSNVDKENYKNFFISLGNVLPCEICQVNYKNHLEELCINDYLNTRKDLVNWFIKIHNLVNKELNKPILQPKIALNKLKDLDVYNNCCIFYIIIIILIIIIIILLYNFLPQTKLFKYNINNKICKIIKKM